jgi:hypothetical protein
MDGDGDQDFDDIEAFVEALNSGGQSASSAVFALDSDDGDPLVATGADGQTSRAAQNLLQDRSWRVVPKQEMPRELWSPRARWTSKHDLADESDLDDRSNSGRKR